MNVLLCALFALEVTILGSCSLLLLNIIHKLKRSSKLILTEYICKIFIPITYKYHHYIGTSSLNSKH